jgi:16S rRNA (guanine527-N7)-methyltransferase
MNIEKIKNDNRFRLYFELLKEYNQKFNLTAIIEESEVQEKHFFDSVLPIEFFAKNARVLDVGAGAGFPGICLKLVRDDLDVTMLDSVNKKVEFLKILIKELNLQGICAVHKRIEDFLDRNFDVVTARAVAPLNILAEYCLPFVKIGGIMIAYKGKDAAEEVKNAKGAIEILGGGEVKVEEIPLSKDIKRSFVIIKKIKKSGAGFPRGGNKPRLKPL